MKRNIILGCICTAFSLSACDNYLDVVPKGKSVLNTTQDYIGLLEPIDATYPIDNFVYTGNEQTWNNRTDLEGYTYMVRSAGFFWNEEYDRASNITDEENCSFLYNKCYERISRYNILIDNIGNAEGPDSEKAMGTAQAKTMRAYNYFFLLNTFAKPYNPATSATDPGIIVRKKFELEAPARQHTVAETYDFILQDLNESINNLPEKAENVLRPDKAFGYAVRAKVHLFMRNIDKALEDALEALKFPNHRLWDLNAEVAAFISKNPGFASSPDASIWNMMSMMAPIKHPFSDSENLFYGYNNMAGGPAIIRKHIRDLFDPTSDLRFNLICSPKQPARPNAEPGCLYFMNSAFIQLNESGIRLSEVYLMVAECYARKGNIDLALKYLNDLRKTRIATSKYKDLIPADVNNDKDKALTYIRQERSRELLTSCNSFFDMRRFCTEFNETLTKTYIDTGGTTHTYTLKPDSHLLTFPFPVKAIQTTNLIQNSK